MIAFTCSIFLVSFFFSLKRNEVSVLVSVVKKPNKFKAAQFVSWRGCEHSRFVLLPFLT